MNYNQDQRIVMTLDAGGTNFVFCAVQANQEIIDPIRLPSNADDLDRCLDTIIEGFEQVKAKLKEPPVAISFAFPGPTDYPNGIIGDLENLPCFRGGVALGSMLEEKFQIPVYINNDGDLFVYGEAISGLLPEINQLFKEKGNPKQFNNLFGVTLGTGFGGGIVTKGELYIGDNSSGAEIWCTRHKIDRKSYAEEGASIRAVKRVYAEEAQIPVSDAPEPKDIFEIAKGIQKGNKEAAVKSFETLGEVVGEAMANAITMLDGLIVVGGGLAGAAELIFPSIIKELNSKIYSLDGRPLDRIPLKVFNLEDKASLEEFIKGQSHEIAIPRSEKKITYDPMRRTAVGLSRLGTSKAVSIGAYAFALNQLDKK